MITVKRNNTTLSIKPCELERFKALGYDEVKPKSTGKGVKHGN